MASFADEFFAAERGLYETLVGLCAERGLSHEIIENYAFFAKLNGHCLFWLRRYPKGVCFCARRTLSPEGGDNILRRPFSAGNADEILAAAHDILNQARAAGLYTATIPEDEEIDENAEESELECAEDDATEAIYAPEAMPTHPADNSAADVLRAAIGALEEHVRLHGDFPLEMHGKRLKHSVILLSHLNIHTASELVAFGAENLLAARGMGPKALRRLSLYLAGCTDENLPPKRKSETGTGTTKTARSEIDEKVLAALDAGYRAEPSAERRAKLSFASARFFALLSELLEELCRSCEDGTGPLSPKIRRSILLFLAYAQTDKTLAEMGEEMDVTRARISQLVMRGRKSALIYLSRAYGKQTEPYYTKLCELFALLADVEYDVLHLFEYGAIARSRRSRIELSCLVFGKETVGKISKQLAKRQRDRF